MSTDSNIQTKQQTFVSDVIAGLTTSFAAIALGAAFGIQSGRGAFAGMIAASIIPIITSIFGGTRLQASGPTAPMTAVSVLVIGYAYTTFGKVEGEHFITLVFLLNALFLILAGILRLGRFIALVPQVVILGFMNGIALLIWWDQIKKIFGLGGTIPMQGEIWQNFLLALVTFAGILLFPKLLSLAKVPEKIRPFVPGTLVVVIALTYIFVLSSLNLQTVQLGSSVGSLPDLFRSVSRFIPPLSYINQENLLRALPFALQLTLLAYLDSLLTSLVIDNITKEKSAKNKELIAQGLANGVSSFFGGIPGAQATIRSVILLKEGAKTRLAGVLVGVFALAGLFIFQGVVSLVASAIFVGVLFKAGLDVFEKDYFKNFWQNQGWQKKEMLWQFGFVVYTTLITVFFDLNIAVFTGTILFYLTKYFLGVQDFAGQEEDAVKNEA